MVYAILECGFILLLKQVDGEHLQALLKRAIDIYCNISRVICKQLLETLQIKFSR